MNGWKLATAIILGVLAVLLGLYDVFAAAFGGCGSTISQVTYHAARAEPIIAFAFGVLVGHLFWPQKKEC